MLMQQDEKDDIGVGLSEFQSPPDNQVNHPE